MKKMEMYKCEKCGAFFDEPEFDTAWEYRGECWGQPSFERVSDLKCPECGTLEMVVEAEVCELCGEPYLWDETESQICPNCMMSHSNIDFCYKAGAECADDIELNGFLLSMFSKEKIEEILLRELKQANEITPINCVPFIEKDASWFGEIVVAEEVRTNENSENK